MIISQGSSVSFPVLRFAVLSPSLLQTKQEALTKHIDMIKGHHWTIQAIMPGRWSKTLIRSQFGNREILCVRFPPVSVRTFVPLRFFCLPPSFFLCVLAVWCRLMADKELALLLLAKGQQAIYGHTAYNTPHSSSQGRRSSRCSIHVPRQDTAWKAPILWEIEKCTVWTSLSFRMNTSLFCV